LIYPLHFSHSQPAGKVPSAQDSHSAFVSKHGCLKSILHTVQGIEEGQLSHTASQSSLSLPQVLKKKIETNRIKESLLVFISSDLRIKVLLVGVICNDMGQRKDVSG
jgi:hypothetical protein